MKKIFGYKSITHLLYGIIVLMPFLTILGRCMYTIVNKNAKDSYSAKTIYQQFAITNSSQYPLDQVINIKYKSSIPDVGYYVINGVVYISYTAEELNISQVNYDSINQIRFYKVLGHDVIYLNSGSTTIKTLTWDDTIDFNLVSTSQPNNEVLYSFVLLSQTILVQDNLDNAFEYSISNFTKNNNFGNVDLFSWFTDTFLDTTNAKNMLYINFVNWYLNYTLFVSCGYLLFLVLLWFVNYSRALLDKGMNKDYGGY